LVITSQISEKLFKVAQVSPVPSLAEVGFEFDWPFQVGYPKSHSKLQIFEYEGKPWARRSIGNSYAYKKETNKGFLM
jgi:hypothetical protein